VNHHKNVFFFNLLNLFLLHYNTSIVEGRYEGIHHINFQRDYGKHGSIEEIQQFYRALRLFTGLVILPENQYKIKLSPGKWDQELSITIELGGRAKKMRGFFNSQKVVFPDLLGLLGRLS